MLIDPSGVSVGMDALLPGLQKLPFAGVLFGNLIFPGVALIIVNGVTQLTAAVMMLAKHKNALVASLLCGVILMLWITIQFFIFERNFMSISYFIFGAIELALALLCKWRARVENAAVSTEAAASDAEGKAE